MNIIDNLQWRYATKKFNPNFQIPQNKLEIILKSIELSPTSFGLQALKILAIKNKKVLEELGQHTYGQLQIKTCSCLLVFCSYKNLSKEFFDNHRMEMEKIMGKEETENTIKAVQNYLNSQSESSIESWLSRQAYIALGIAIASASENKIDNCPMEGFEQSAFKEILDLKEMNINVVLALGERDISENVKKKFRKANTIIL